ncbi:MAG: mobile mystery protein B [Actinobacteria bacterium]|nr:mobile mystery protein B [Actinomycetota bacterium]
MDTGPRPDEPLGVQSTAATEDPNGVTPLDPDEAEGLIPTWVATRGALNEAEQANIGTAVAWLARRTWTPEEVLDVDWLLRLHQRMFSDVWKWAGKTRTTGKNLGVPVEDIRPQLANLIADATFWFSNAGKDPVPDLAAFHHRLVWIHAFANGNGRHGRLATDILARSIGHDAPRWGSEVLDAPSETRAVYIAALRAADNNDLDPLVVFLRA